MLIFQFKLKLKLNGGGKMSEEKFEIDVEEIQDIVNYLEDMERLIWEVGRELCIFRQELQEKLEKTKK